MYCKNCGNEINLNVKRCKKCGFVNDFYKETQTVQINNHSRTDNVYEQPHNSTTHGSKKRKSFVPRLIACILAVILAFGVGSFVTTRFDYRRCMSAGNAFMEQEDYDAAISCFVIAERKKETAAEPYAKHLEVLTLKESIDTEAVIELFTEAYNKCSDSDGLNEALIQITQNLSDVDALRILKGAYDVCSRQELKEEWYSRSETAVKAMLETVYPRFKDNDDATAEVIEEIFNSDYGDILNVIPEDLYDDNDNVYIDESTKVSDKKMMGIGLHHMQAKDISNLDDKPTFMNIKGDKQDSPSSYGYFLYYGYYEVEDENYTMTGSGILIDTAS